MADITPPDREHSIVDQDDKSTLIMFQWMVLISNLLANGFTGTIVTAALTGGGTTGSMTFQNGVLTAQTPAT